MSTKILLHICILLCELTWTEFLNWTLNEVYQWTLERWTKSRHFERELLDWIIFLNGNKPALSALSRVRPIMFERTVMSYSSGHELDKVQYTAIPTQVKADLGNLSDNFLSTPSPTPNFLCLSRSIVILKIWVLGGITVWIWIERVGNKWNWEINVWGVKRVLILFLYNFVLHGSSGRSGPAPLEKNIKNNIER